MNTITCPHCGKEVEISQAIKHQIESEALTELDEKHKKELELAKKDAIDASTKKLQEQFSLQVKEAKEEAQDKENRIKELLEKLSESADERRALKREKDEVKLEMQKTLALEEEKIRADAQKKAEEEQHLKILEKDKQLQDALKSNEEMRRKLQQGSQQTQGEVFEQEFETLLRTEFPNDLIKEVAKGVRGGDIIQEVWDRNGTKCGTILWELKNTKTWSEPWIEKIKTDQRSIMADYAVIISEATPPSVDSAKYYKNVWVTKRNFVIGLACALRINLIQLAMAKRASEGRREKTDILYSYISSTEFRLRIEAIIEAFTHLQEETEKEKRYFANKWARDEKNIRQVIDSTFGMHGDLKGIIGNVLPQIKGLQELESGNDQ